MHGRIKMMTSMCPAWARIFHPTYPRRQHHVPRPSNFRRPRLSWFVHSGFLQLALSWCFFGPVTCDEYPHFKGATAFANNTAKTNGFIEPFGSLFCGEMSSVPMLPSGFFDSEHAAPASRTVASEEQNMSSATLTTCTAKMARILWFWFLLLHLSVAVLFSSSHAHDLFLVVTFSHGSRPRRRSCTQQVGGMDLQHHFHIRSSPASL